MSDRDKLLAIKLFHTAVWIFMNVVIFYLLYAVDHRPHRSLGLVGVGSDRAGILGVAALSDGLPANTGGTPFFRLVRCELRYLTAGMAGAAQQADLRAAAGRDIVGAGVSGVGVSQVVPMIFDV
jgi:hypothetical protein